MAFNRTYGVVLYKKNGIITWIFFDLADEFYVDRHRRVAITLLSNRIAIT